MKKNIKRLFGVLAFVSFFIMLGCVGALEQDMVSFGTGTIRIFASLGVWVFFTWLADGFKPYSYEKRENRPGVVQTPKGDEQNTHLDYTRTIYF